MKLNTDKLFCIRLNSINFIESQKRKTSHFFDSKYSCNLFSDSNERKKRFVSRLKINKWWEERGGQRLKQVRKLRNFSFHFLQKIKISIFFSCFTYCYLLLLLSFRWYSILNDALWHRIKMHSHFDSIRFKYDRKTHTHTHTHTRNFFFCFSFSISVLRLFAYNSQMSLIIVQDDDDDDDDDDDNVKHTYSVDLD